MGGEPPRTCAWPPGTEKWPSVGPPGKFACGGGHAAQLVGNPGNPEFSVMGGGLFCWYFKVIDVNCVGASAVQFPGPFPRSTGKVDRMRFLRRWCGQANCM